MAKKTPGIDRLSDDGFVPVRISEEAWQRKLAASKAAAEERWREMQRESAEKVAEAREDK